MYRRRQTPANLLGAVIENGGFFRNTYVAR